MHFLCTESIHDLLLCTCQVRESRFNTAIYKLRCNASFTSRLHVNLVSFLQRRTSGFATIVLLQMRTAAKAAGVSNTTRAAFRIFHTKKYMTCAVNARICCSLIGTNFAWISTVLQRIIGCYRFHCSLRWA